MGVPQKFNYCGGVALILNYGGGGLRRKIVKYPPVFLNGIALMGKNFQDGRSVIALHYMYKFM